MPKFRAQRTALTQAQKQWLAKRRACKSDTACLLQLYRQRIKELF